MAERTAQDYWAQVATLPIEQVKGGGSDNYQMVNQVDWSSVFAGTTKQSATWVLGYDPIALVWVNDKAQYWSLTEVNALKLNYRLDDHEARIQKLEKK